MGLLKVYLSGVEYIPTNKYNIREQVGQTATAKISVRLDDNDIPVTHQLLEVKDNSGNEIYTGIVQAVDTPTYKSEYQTDVFSLSVKSLDVIFDYRIVNESYEEMTTTEIIDDIFDNYLLEEGLTKGTIDDFDRTYTKYVSSGLTLRKVLDELGDAVEAAAFISADKVFSFKSISSFQEVTQPDKITNIKEVRNGTGLRSVQRLSGANEETTLQTESVVWGTNQSTFVVGYQLSTVEGMTINAVLANVGILGVDDGDPTITFLTRYGSQTITVNAAATTKPTTGDIVAIVYNGFFSIEIQSINESLIQELNTLNGTSGKIENQMIDTSITNYADGQDEADSLLDRFSEREKTISLITDTDELLTTTPLNLWVLDYPELGIEGDYVIVERSITDKYDRFSISVKLKNKNFYSRYGTVLDKNDSTINNLAIRTDDKIVKTSSLFEDLNPVDSVSIYTTGIIYYPATGDNLYNPSTLGDMYPAG